ncbi:hypothetical protein [Rhodobaculum claviforme]|uniref:YtkA-like domain-containing protein n=1 Tax=Rhodobaculum claviforme TaxID=1549854 RepID=A0A934TJY2_9RHOB|nr:hypothetical protein [Rhodobaculum claviforme]MBK5926901.1 hypothetical protein [Rhodobaculum claviforme]
MTRIIAAALAVFFLGLVALMASVTLFVRDPMPVLSARVPVSIERDGVRATVAVDPTYRFEVTAEGLPRDIAPDLTMHRGEADGRAVEMEVTDAGAGLVQGFGQFTAPGRWTLTLMGGDGPVEFGFVLQE